MGLPLAVQPLLPHNAGIAGGAGAWAGWECPWDPTLCAARLNWVGLVVVFAVPCCARCIRLLGCRVRVPSGRLAGWHDSPTCPTPTANLLHPCRMHTVAFGSVHQPCGAPACRITLPAACLINVAPCCPFAPTQRSRGGSRPPATRGTTARQCGTRTFSFWWRTQPTRCVPLYCWTAIAVLPLLHSACGLGALLPSACVLMAVQQGLQAQCQVYEAACQPVACLLPPAFSLPP